MNSHILSWLPILLSFIILSLFLQFPLSSSTNPEQSLYRDCGSTFNCGSITGLDYPFRGEDEPEYCGYPGLVLNCQNNIATFYINHLKFRVLGIDQAAQTMRIAREDVIEATCPQDLVDTTLDDTLFEYVSSGYRNLSFLYGCPAPVGLILGIIKLVTCNISGYNSVYLLPETPIPLGCDVRITVPVHDWVGSLIPQEWEQAIQGGFEVRWKVDSRVCMECSRSKGRCGYNLVTKQSTCYCPDPPYVSDTCSTTAGAGLRSTPTLGSNSSKPSSTNTALIIVSAVLAGIGLGWGIFACTQRKKRIAAQSSISAAAKSKDIPSPTLSKGLITPSASFSHSIPSYPFPSIEFGKASTYFGAQVFSYTELEEATNNFDPSRELGDGGFGTVYYGKLQDGRVVAVKRLYENNFKRVEQFMNEVEILTRLRHENLVALYGCTSKRSRELLLVYEYIPNGTVGDHLHGKRANSGLLSWPVRLSIATETAVALAYLHASDIIHRDVKTNNILLDNNFRVKVADFGLSRLFPNNVTHVSTAPQGTPGYVDPEYYQCYQLTEKSDVYSFGVVLIELISSKQAVDTNRSRQDINLANMAMNKIQNRALHELVDPSLGFETNSSVRRMTTLVAELAFQCLQTDREMRPSMQEVLEALRKIRNEDLNVQKAEVVDILKGNFPLMSPDLEAAEKWVSNSTTPSSSG
ncbi:hypothetical protein CsSME_00003935 [Camellia sinensis var. sinensis]